MAQQAGIYPGFRSMKRLGVFLLLPGWDASPLQGYPPALNSPVPIYTGVACGTISLPSFNGLHCKLTKIALEWNLDLMKLLVNGQICSLNGGFVISKTAI